MSAYFRMGFEVIDQECVRDLSKCGKGDHFASNRILLYIYLLLYALSPSKEFTDADALSAYSGIGISHARRVWDTCLKYGILRKSRYGYSARSWLIEKKFLGRYEKDIDRAYEEGIHGKECS